MQRSGGPPTGVIHYPVPQPRLAPLGRSDFGLAEDAFVSLCLFDASSIVERKNPLGAIAAHRAAFGEDETKVLVVKTYNTILAGPGWQDVLEAARGHGNIRIIDQKMSREEVWSLLALSDVFISLHRSEGVGLALLEAMRLGRAVLATAWSGNMDFMDDSNAALVPYHEVPASDERGVYSVCGSTWAEPHIPSAALLLQRLFRDASWRAQMGQAAMARTSLLDNLTCGEHALRVMEGLGGAMQTPHDTSAGRLIA